MAERKRVAQSKAKPARLAARKPPARKKGIGQLQMRDMPLELMNEFTESKVFRGGAPLGAAVDRVLFVVLLSEVALLQADPRGWLAEVAADGARAAAETRRDGPSDAWAARIGAMVAEVMEGAQDRLEARLRRRGPQAAEGTS
jgi:hypothetical protein